MPWMLLKTIGGFVLRYWYVIVIAVFVASWMHRGHTITKLEKTLAETNQKLEGFNQAIKTLDQAIQMNDVAMQECLTANHDNEVLLADMNRKMKIASEKVKQFQRNATSHQQEIDREANNLRGRDTGCRSLHDPNFPQWFIDWVRAESS